MLPQTERFNVEVEASNEAEIVELQMEQRTARMVRYGIFAAAILLEILFLVFVVISHSNFFQV
ncbi:hypothetical protein [Brucella sp. 2716]|uniref:hypothetical protein n=1 Tax=Brucella sp. 2716 TaxID=2975052 RepID=UPI00217DB19C|nr:hypothetical protein [Brucella sp. 2716]UWF60010.1 hypothetical protein NYO66_13445 [Brucella sp. 2716]